MFFDNRMLDLRRLNPEFNAAELQHDEVRSRKRFGLAAIALGAAAIVSRFLPGRNS